MNELLKVKYYKLIKTKDLLHYEKVGNILALIEDQLIMSENTVSKEELVKLLFPLKGNDNDVYEEVVKDINNGQIYGDVDDE